MVSISHWGLFCVPVPMSWRPEELNWLMRHVVLV
jgi:hypothetical protein